MEELNYEIKTFDENNEYDVLCDLRNKAFINSEFGGNFKVSTEFKNEFHNNNFLLKECNKCKVIRNISRTNNIRGINCNKCKIFKKTCGKCIMTQCDKCVDLIIYCNNCHSKKKSSIEESLICDECFDKPETFFIYKSGKEQPIDGIIEKVSNIFYPERHKILNEYKDSMYEIKYKIMKINKEINNLEKLELKYKLLMEEAEKQNNTFYRIVTESEDTLKDEIDYDYEDNHKNEISFGVCEFNYNKCIKKIDLYKKELQTLNLSMIEEKEKVNLELSKLSICIFDHLNYDNQYKDLYVFENLINKGYYTYEEIVRKYCKYLKINANIDMYILMRNFMENMPICSSNIKKCEISNRKKNIDEKKINIDQIHLSKNTVYYWLRFVKLHYVNDSISIENLYKSYKLFIDSEEIETDNASLKVFLSELKKLLKHNKYKQKRKGNKIYYVGLGMKNPNIKLNEEIENKYKSDNIIDEENEAIDNENIINAQKNMNKAYYIQNKIKNKLINCDNIILNSTTNNTNDTDESLIHNWIQNYIKFDEPKQFLLLPEIYDSYINNTKIKISIEKFKLTFNNIVRGKVEASLYKGTIRYDNIMFKFNKIEI
jgi:hypothetical protein